MSAVKMESRIDDLISWTGEVKKRLGGKKSVDFLPFYSGK